MEEERQSWKRPKRIMKKYIRKPKYNSYRTRSNYANYAVMKNEPKYFVIN